MDLEAIFGEAETKPAMLALPPTVPPVATAVSTKLPPAEPPLESWTEIRNGATWHIIAVAGEDVFNWCDRPPVPRGICSTEAIQ